MFSLYHRIMDASGGILSTQYVGEIRKNGSGIAKATLDHLKGDDLPNTIGINVLSVHTTVIKATDTGNDALATFQKESYERVQTYLINNRLAITPETLLYSNPEIYMQLLAGKQEVLRAMIDKGLLAPEGILNQPLENNGQEYLKDTSGWLDSLLPGTPKPAPVTENPNPPAQIPSPAGNDQSRIQEDIRYIKNGISGSNVKPNMVLDDNGVQTGGFTLKVDFPRISGGEMATVEFTCPASYPTEKPVAKLMVNGEERRFCVE